MIDSFSGTYAEAREKFVTAARDAKARVHSYARGDLRGREGEHLACDVGVLGSDDAERAAIVITGTHGIEGYCGSAILHRWLASRASNPAIDDIKVVLVHALNCWGFSHKTRTTENNVDLNRNCLLEEGAYDRENPSYDRLIPFLHATALDAAESLRAYRAYRSYLDQHGWHIETEAFEGQSNHPEGIYYTGKESEWANHVFRRIVNEQLGRANVIGFIDWHTGAGSFGEVVPFIFDDKGSLEHTAAAGWWGHADTDKGPFAAGALPKYRGLVCRAIHQEISASRIAGAVIEIGTGDEYSMFRADRLDRWLWFEGRRDGDYDQLREDYKNALCPRDVAWRRLVMRAGPAAMDRLVEGVRSWQV